MDVARGDPVDAQNLLIISSACHGVEGYCGSGVQVHALHDVDWLEKARASGMAVLYIHALNPYGFSHIRRTTQENVDLNRNFQDFKKPLPDNAAYCALHRLILPEAWPPNADNRAAITDFMATKGPAAYQSAITQGQHEFADGLFYGGNAPTPITSIYDGSSTSAFLTGLMWHSIYQEAPQAEYTGIAMEYGTVPVIDVLQALRAEHWLNNHPEAPAALAQQIKAQMLAAFYTDTDLWRGQIISQARQAMFQAVGGLTA